MDENLRVDPADVHLAGCHVDVHAGEFSSGHASTHQRIAAARGGFIGASAAALAAMTADWVDESAAHHRELCGHADDLRAAAARYQTTDTEATTHIDAAAAKLAKRMGI